MLKRRLAPPELEINPAQLYSTVETLQRLPSCRGGCITIDTLVRWRKAGHIKGHRVLGHWFYKGEEILRVLGRDLELPAGFQSPAQRKREHESVMKELRTRGVLK